jgi:hypothetical protein
LVLAHHVCNTLQGSYVPEQKIKLRHGDQLVVIGLPDNIRFNYLRSGVTPVMCCIRWL